ncbi:MAG: cupin [Planctomycetota bacterium]|nr:MAG: cupin [Planctomycetota bacterium]
MNTPPRKHVRNVYALVKQEEVAHEGDGALRFCRPFTANELHSELNFVDFVEIPPGVSIGEHRHAADEEIYFIVSGNGWMTLEGHSFAVEKGDLIRNLPGGQHALMATGKEDLHLLVFDARVKEG